MPSPRDRLRRALTPPPPDLTGIERRLEDLNVLQGRVLARQIGRENVSSLHEAEFKVFSQFGDDGIVEHLVARLDVPVAAQSFVEIGVEDYTEANTRFLLITRNWRGLVVDSSPEHAEHIRRSPLMWRHDLRVVEAFVDRDNVNELLESNGFGGEIGLLSIDLDGNDYWIWEAVESARPLIVVVEYNSVFGRDRAVTIPYDPIFTRRRAHFSHLYWGASLKALALLGERKGYTLVGSNSVGNNAFFVRREHAGGLPGPSAAEAYVESRIRESRGEDGELTYVGGLDRLRLIRELPVWDVEREQEILVEALLPS
jgi:hypothetical protein